MKKLRRKNKLTSNVPTSHIQSVISNNGITLIALIITIIILLILAAVTLNMIFGENDILQKARIAKRNTEIAYYKEEIERTHLELMAQKNGQEEVTYQEWIQQLVDKGIIEETIEKYILNVQVSAITMPELNAENEYPLVTAKDKEYKYYLKLNGKAIYVDENGIPTPDPGEEEENPNPAPVADYQKVNEWNTSNVEIENRVNRIKDAKVQDKDIIFTNVKLNDNENAIYYDGTTTPVGKTDGGNLNISFPCTISYIVKPEDMSSVAGFVLADSKTKMLLAIRKVDNAVRMSCSTSVNSIYEVSNEIWSEENINYITITYGTSITDIQLYVNGTKIETKIKGNSDWVLNSQNYTTIGYRSYSNKNPYKGEIYEISLYNTVLSDGDIVNLYNGKKSYFENNTSDTNVASDYLVAQYNVKNKTNIETEKYAKDFKDSISNNNATLTNVKLSDDNKFIYFAGSTSSIGKTSSNINVTYPFTITYIIKPEEITTSRIVFADSSIKTIMSMFPSGDNIRICCSPTTSPTYDIPKENFMDEKIKYLTVTYGTGVTDHQLYINGEKIERSSNTSYYNLTSKSFSTMGYRIFTNGNSYPYKGNIYSIITYNKQLKDEQVKKEYNSYFKKYN